MLDYYAKKLATCSSDSVIKVYDILGDQQYQHLADLNGHDGPVWQIAWAHPMFGSVLASCSFDGKVIIHREQPVGQWNKVFVYSDMQSSVNSVAWAPHEYNLCLACVTSDGKIAILSHNPNDLWSASVLEVPTGLGLNAVSWAPFSSYSSLSERRFVTGGFDHKLRIWCSRDDGSGNFENWEEEKVLYGAHTDWVRDIAWAPSIGLPSSTIASCSEDGKVIVWTQKKAGFDWEQTIVRDTKGVPVWRVSWSITGSILAVSAGYSEVTLWKEAADGKEWVQVSDINTETNTNLPANQQEDTQRNGLYQQGDFSQQQNMYGQQQTMNNQQQNSVQKNYLEQQSSQYRGMASHQYSQQQPPPQQPFTQPPPQQQMTQPQFSAPPQHHQPQQVGIPNGQQYF